MAVQKRLVSVFSRDMTVCSQDAEISSVAGNDDHFVPCSCSSGSTSLDDGPLRRCWWVMVRL